MSIFTKITATIMTTCMLFVFSGCGSSEFAEKTGMNQSQESTALAVFKDNGIGELKNVTKYKDNPPTFAAKYGEYGEILFSLAQDKQIDGIMYGPETVYRSGKSVNKLSDLLIKDKEREDYTFSAWNAVRSKLKNPNSADFSSMPTVSRNKDIVLVVGKVKAQNSFGGTIQSSYRVKMQLPDKKILECTVK